jgi:hypothetical protein
MANEFKVKNGLIVIGDLTTSGTITINGALAATQSWVTSQAYLTSASLSGYATQSYVTSAISSLIDAAPAALDTLNELAAALGDDANFSTTITNSIASKQSQLNGTGLVRMSGTSVSYDNTTYLVSNFGNIEGDHTYGYPSSEGWYKIAEVVLTSTCQSFNLWGEYRDTGYFDNSHYRIHITARAECDFPTNNENHAINVNIYGSSTNDTYFSNNVRVVLTQSSSNYRKYELQYYRSTWDTGSWRLQTLGWTTYTTSQTAGTPTGTPRVYYVSKFSTDNIFVSNRISIGTTYAGFAANIAGTTYIIGASAWVNDGYGITNASSPGTGFFPYSDGNSVINSNNTTRLFVNGSTGNIGIGTSSPASKLQVAGDIRIQNETGLITDYGPLIGRYNTSQVYVGTGGSYSIVKIGRDDGGALNVLSGGNVGIGTTSPIYKLQVAGSAYVNGGTLFLDSDQYLRWGNSNQGIVGSNDNHVSIVSGGATRQSIYADGRTYFPGLDLSISNVNSTHGTANYFRGDTSHFVLGTGGTLYLNYANTSGSTFIYGTTYVNGNIVWHAGNDGTGSGLDADTVDGVQADSIVYGNARGTNQSITNNNNDLDKTGYYTADAFTTRPSGVANWMYIEHIKLYNDNTAYQKQLGYDTYDDRMWVRTKSGGAWSSWKQIWTSDSLTNLNQLTNGPGYITGYSETDTLASVTGRGATTSTNISVNNVKIGTDGTYGGGYSTIGFGGTTNGYNRVFGNNGTSDGLFLASATGVGIYFRTNGGSTDHMVITSAGNVGIGTTTPYGKLDVYTGGSGSWTRFVVTTTDLWGDSGTQYVTIGAGGAAGIMIHNPHIVWDGAKAAIRLGRSGGVSGGAWYQVGTMAGDEFMIAKNGEWGNGGIKINSSGVLYYGSTGYRYIWENGTWGINITGNANYANTAGSTSYATTAGALTSMNISQFTNNSGYVAYGNYSWTSPVFGQYGIKSNLIDNVLYSAADRFEVFKDGVAWNTNCVFNLNYDQNCDVIPTSTSRTYSIVLNTKGNSSSGITYTEGNVYLSFYYVYIPASVSGRVRFQNGTWVNMSGWTNVANSGSYAVWRGNVPGGNYMVEIEITINASASINTWFAQWEYVMGRPGQYELGIINKAQDNSLWRNMYFRDSSNNVQVSIGASGLSTSQNLHISGTSALYFPSYGGGFYMQDSSWIRTVNYKSIWTQTGLLGTDGGLTVGYGGATPPSGGAIISGNVGIGATSLEAKLHVVSGASQAGILSRGVSGDTWFPYSNGQNYVRGVTNFDLGSVYFTGGNIGIGTSSPGDYKLYVNGGQFGTLLRGGDLGTGSDVVRMIKSDNSVAMLVRGDGKVGIGTLSPSEEFHVIGRGIFDGGSGNSSTDAVVYITKSNNNDWGLYVNAAALDYGMYARVSPSAGYAIAVNNGTSWTTRITGDGRIYLNEKDTIASYDTWLRLNESSHYGSGVYTPGLMRADGGFQVSGSTVWHAGNDGSGSGLDADLLDGLHASSFVRNDTTGQYLKPYYEYGSSLSASTTPSTIVSQMGGGGLRVDFLQNPSFGSWGHSITWSGYNGYNMYQLAGHYKGSGGEGPDLYVRCEPNHAQNSWSSWQKLWHSGHFTDTNISNWNTAYGWGNHASQSYATTSYVTTQINNLIAGAPGALDTLDELAAALGDDSSFATTVTNSIATKLPLAGGTMTGDINWTQTDRGLTWGMNTDGAYIKFYNTGDGDVNSRLEYATSDNGDEYHRWLIAGTEKMTLKWAGLTINGTITATGYNNTNWDTAYSSLANYLPLAGGTMSGSINMNGNNVINIGQVNATHAIFTNDGSSRVMYLRGSGNIIQFQNAAATDKWEIVGRDGEFYVYKSDGAGSGYKWRIDGVGNHTITGNLTVAGTITESSSIKLKENVKTSEGKLEQVVNLRPVTYNKIGSQTTELGLIAEEVAEVYPEFVQYDENGEPVGVHYSRLTAALIGAVKELTNQVQELNKKING